MYTNRMWPRIALSALAMLFARSMSGFFTRLWYVLRQLWHEVIGFVFLVLAVVGASAILREWRGGSGTRVLFAVAFTLMMLYFGFTSFRSARKVR